MREPTIATRVLVLGQQFALDVEHHRRVVNLLEQFRVIFVRLDDNVAAEFLDALQFALQVHIFFPVGDGRGNFRPDAVDPLQLGPAGAQDVGGLGEMAQQLPDAHRADAFNHIQSHQRFPGIHAN